MKKLIFVCSHLHSGSSVLCEILNQHPRIQICKNFEKQNYFHPLDIFQETSNPHKINNKSALYLDHLLYNYQLSIKAAFSYCRFIYVVRSPEPTINLLVQHNQMDENQATRYYTYRLRRIYEMAKNTSFVLLTWEDLKNNNYAEIIENYLELSQPIEKNSDKFINFEKSEFFSNSLDLSDVENKYQKYLYSLKEQISVHH